MPSVYALYNEEVVQGHREALAVLRELLAQETDPAERRKLANALLRAKPVKDPEAPPPSPAPSGRRHYEALQVTDTGDSAPRSARRGEDTEGSVAADESLPPPAPHKEKPDVIDTLTRAFDLIRELDDASAPQTS